MILLTLDGLGMADVFISYKSEDRERVAPIAAALTGGGFSVWWDAHVDTGERYADRIAAELDSAKAVVVVWSQHSTKSDWVREEADQARHANKLVPVRIDGAKIPPPFNQFQCADLTNWDGRSGNAWERTFTAIHNLVTGRARHSPARQPRPANSSLKSDRGSIALAEVVSIEPIPRFFRSANTLRWLFKATASIANILVGLTLVIALIDVSNAESTFLRWESLGLPDFGALLGPLFWPVYIAALILICCMLGVNAVRPFGGFSDGLGALVSIAVLFLFFWWYSTNASSLFEVRANSPFDVREPTRVIAGWGPMALYFAIPTMLAALIAPIVLESLSRKDVKIQTKRGMITWRNLSDRETKELIAEFERFRQL